MIVIDLRQQQGFTLIELVTTLILVGIIGTFAGFFLYSGITGFISSKTSSESALKAQITLDRISAELRHITSLPAANPPVANTSITYQSSSLVGTRRIRYDAGSRNIFLSVDGNENPLIDQVTSFTLNLNSADLDNADGDQEVSAINVGFTIADIGMPFNLRMYPRALIDSP